MINYKKISEIIDKAIAKETAESYINFFKNLSEEEEIKDVRCNILPLPEPLNEYTESNMDIKRINQIFHSFDNKIHNIDQKNISTNSDFQKSIILPLNSEKLSNIA